MSSSSMSNFSENENQFIFSWKIVNFSLCAQRNREELRSPSFTIDNFDETSWYLSLYPRGFQKNTKSEYLSCFLNRVKEKGKTLNLSIELKLEILSSSGFPIVSKNLRGEINQPLQNRMGWDDFVRRGELFQFKKSYLPDDILNLNCTIVNCLHSKKISAPGQSVCTTIAADMFEFKWDVIYSKCSEVKKVSLSCFAIAKLKLYMCDDDIKISIQINETKNRSGLHDKFTYLKIQVSLLDFYENEYLVGEDIFLFEDRKGISERELKTTIKRNHLNSKEADIFIKDDKFTLYCDLSLSDGNISSKSEEFKAQILSETKHNKLDVFDILRDDLRRLYVEKLHADVELQVNNAVFRAHKSILAIRSPVFSKLLENSNNTVVISDIEEKIFGIMLEFIYTGFVNISGYGSVIKLILAANKYQILSLKEKCSTFLKFYLSEDTACEVLSVAHSIKHNNLKTSAINYIKTHFANFRFSNKYRHFLETQPKLATEVLGQISAEIKADVSKKDLNGKKRNTIEIFSSTNLKNSNSLTSPALSHSTLMNPPIFNVSSSAPNTALISTLPLSSASSKDASSNTAINFKLPTGTGAVMKVGDSKSIGTRYQNVTRKKRYSAINKNLEELRVKDPVANRKGGSSTTALGFSTAPQVAANGFSFFGIPAAASSSFSFSLTSTTQSKSVFGSTSMQNKSNSTSLALASSYFNHTLPSSFKFSSTTATTSNTLTATISTATISTTTSATTSGLPTSAISTSGFSSLSLTNTSLSSPPSLDGCTLSSKENDKSIDNCCENVDSFIFDEDILSLLQHDDDDVSEELSSSSTAIESK